MCNLIPIEKYVFSFDQTNFFYSCGRGLTDKNSRVYGSSNEGKSSIAPERLYHETSRFSKKIMVGLSAGVSMQGKTCIIFIDPQGTSQWRVLRRLVTR